MAKYVIGDVHGYLDTLEALLEFISPLPEDQIYFLGDLIDRGKQSPEVVELVIKNKYHCVKGNHEQMMIEAGFNWHWYWCKKTKNRYLYRFPELHSKHLDWMANLPLYIDLGEYLLCHAGLNRSKPLDIQLNNTDKFLWDYSLYNTDLENIFFKDKTLVVGHRVTSTINGVEEGSIAKGKGWINVDTSCYSSGWLTALELDSQVAYQAKVAESKVFKRIKDNRPK